MDGNPWYYDIKYFMHHQKYPLGVSNTYMKIMWRLVIDYYLDTEVLYKRSSDAMFLRLLVGTEVKKKKKKVLQEVHKGIFATHASRHMTAKYIGRCFSGWT